MVEAVSFIDLFLFSLEMSTSLSINLFIRANNVKWVILGAKVPRPDPFEKKEHKFPKVLLWRNGSALSLLLVDRVFFRIYEV